jgi:hypothetical protein
LKRESQAASGFRSPQTLRRFQTFARLSTTKSGRTYNSAGFEFINLLLLLIQLLNHNLQRALKAIAEFSHLRPQILNLLLGDSAFRVNLLLRGGAFSLNQLLDFRPLTPYLAHAV